MTVETVDAPVCPQCGTPFEPGSGLMWPDDVVTVLCRQCRDIVLVPASRWPSPRIGL